MPKKKQTRPARRAASRQEIRPRVAIAQHEPTLGDRIKKNPFGIILGVIVVLSMVLGLAADIVQSGKATPTAATPTLVPFSTSTAAVVTTPAAQTTPVAQATSASTTRKTYSAPPAMSIDKTKKYTATIVTAKGNIKLQLLPDVAPNTVNAFVNLARDGFYNGLTFHRVENWVIQGGDPKGDGTGGPGYNLPAEFNATKHITGTLAMARSTDPNSAGSQFYIVKSTASWLDGQYTVFGQTIEGMDVVNKIAIGDIMQKITIDEQ